MLHILINADFYDNAIRFYKYTYLIFRNDKNQIISQLYIKEVPEINPGTFLKQG